MQVQYALIRPVYASVDSMADSKHVVDLSAQTVFSLARFISVLFCFQMYSLMFGLKEV